MATVPDVKNRRLLVHLLMNFVSANATDLFLQPQRHASHDIPSLVNL